MRAPFLAPALPLVSVVLSLAGHGLAADPGPVRNQPEPVPPPQPALSIEDAQCRIEFDGSTGGLRRITNRRLGDECLKHAAAGTMPFRIYADLSSEFEIGINEKFQLRFKDPHAITRTLIQPEACSVKTAQTANGLTLVYQARGLAIRLEVRLTQQAGVSDWFLQVTNTGDVPREFLTCFPFLDGVRLGAEPSTNLATAMDQAGLVVPAWEREGGVLGESNDLSMQWHAIWDPASASALALIFMDAEVRPKRLLLKEPAIALHYFPPVTLAPGTSIDFPAVRLMVYQGDWRLAARAYRAWYDSAFSHVNPPAWFRESNGNAGVHFRKGDRSSYAGQVALQNFRDLPAAHLRSPVDNWEYAFFCQTSMRMKDRDFTPHTDGDNIVREDMGGADALREGIAGDHRLGFHATLYIEGYIVHEESDIVKHGDGKRWAIMRKDGTLTGPYSKQGFYHMCPGCVEWQEHLARMVARLLRETDADAVRLDSLGFYYWPCYNPAHHHETPFGYNQWLKTLLARVRAAAIAVKPDVLLLTEGSADWFGQWFHGALTSRCPRDLSPMRLAVGPFRTYVYASGALWGSLSGFPGGGCGGSDIQTMDWNWLCARFPVHEALVWGDVADVDPRPSDPQIVTRRFEGKGYWAIVAARPACQDPIWPRGTEVSKEHTDYTVSVPGLAAEVEDAALCDVETLTWTPLPVEKVGEELRFKLRTNWGLVILRRHGGPAVVTFEPLPKLKRGESTVLHIRPITKEGNGGGIVSRTITAPGLIVEPPQVAVPGQVTITVPGTALPGNYSVSFSNTNGLGIKRFLVVDSGS
jgi:hypothetical protein